MHRLILTIFYFVILLILLYFLYWLIPDDIPKKTIPLSDINLQTGDLVSCTLPNWSAKIVKLFTRSIWAHTGFIWNLNNQPYVIEIFWKKKRNGMFITKFDDWIDRIVKSKGMRLSYRKYNGPQIMDENVFNVIKKYKKVKVDICIPCWMSSLFKIPYYEEDKLRTKIFCTELIALIMQDLEILQKKYHSSCYSPRKLMFDKLDTMPGYSYDKVIFVIL